LGDRKGIRPVKTEWLGAGVVICLERDADLHMAQLMPLPLTVSCFSKIQICFTFLVPAHPGGPGQRAVKRVKYTDIAVRSLTCHTATGTHMPRGHMGSHSVTCHPAELTFPALPQPKLVLDLATPEGCKAELT